jgi:hypothetical protein
MGQKPVLPSPLYVIRQGVQMSRRKIVAMVGILAAACAVACARQATSPPTALPTPQLTATSTEPAPTRSATPVPPTATPSPTEAKAWATYADPSYQITLRYPSSWQFVPGYGIKYAGPDGFFQLSGISGPSASIDEIAEGEAYHKLSPYGSQPTIESLEVDGQPARFILPSADQPTAMAGQSALIVQLPQPIDVGSDTYDYLVLWSDEEHIQQIFETLSLQNPVARATATVAPAHMPAGVQNALFTLSRQFQTKADQLQLLSYEYVSWPDSCLGVPMRAVCTQAVVPGFRVVIRFEGQDYEYRTDLQGSRLLLASAPSHGITQPVLNWEGGQVCDTLLLGEEGQAAIGPCDAPLRPTQLSEGSSRLEQWLTLRDRFTAFEADTPSGKIVFRGVGQESPSSAWKRAVAAWAQLSYSELESGRTDASWSTAVTWQEEIEDQPGYCRALQVEHFGYAVVSKTLCEGGFTQILGEGWLTGEELATFDAWYYQRAVLQRPDVSFSGVGTAPWSESQTGQLKSWASKLHSRLAGS